MDVYFFLKQRTDLIRHFHNAASAPFVETKQRINDALPPFDDPPYYELYHQPGPVGHALGKLVLFFKQHLVAS